jgi:hypothetical protein
MACVPAHFVTTRLVSLFKGSDYLADFSLVTFVNVAQSRMITQLHFYYGIF